MSVDDSAEIKETDIVFECQHCGKSLAIDYRGAGLTIPCTDCGKEVEVPIPEGMELADIDSTDEEQGVRLMHLRDSLSRTRARVRTLEGEVAELKDQRDKLERRALESAHRSETVLREVELIRRAVDQINDALRRITDASGSRS